MRGYAGKELIDRVEKSYQTKGLSGLAKDFDMPEESMLMVYISFVMLRRIMETMGAELIWAPGVTLCDGIVYEYAEKNKMITPAHNFEQDIIACAQNISKRYRGSKKRSETLEQTRPADF